MIRLFSGTPGSGKSYHAVKECVQQLRHGRGLITNFPLAVDKVKRKKAHYEYLDNAKLNPRNLIIFSKKYNRRYHENETLIVIDEAQLVFNSRTSMQYDRMEWISFFSQHRKLGFEIILIAQNARMIDRQIRDLIEDDVVHRKLNNYGLFGFVIGLFFLNKSIFYCCDRWCGTRTKVGGQWIIYNKDVANIYDTYKLFDEEMSEKDKKKQKEEMQKIVDILNGYLRKKSK